MDTKIYLCWLDDIPTILDSYTGHFDLLKLDYGVAFIIDLHQDSTNFDTIARNIDTGLIFLVDYNLKTNAGEGLDGHEVIQLIRQHNQKCPIVFYSSKATQQELRNLIKDQPNVICVLRGQLLDILTEIANGSFFSNDN